MAQGCPEGFFLYSVFFLSSFPMPKTRDQKPRFFFFSSGCGADVSGCGDAADVPVGVGGVVAAAPPDEAGRPTDSAGTG